MNKWLLCFTIQPFPDPTPYLLIGWEGCSLREGASEGQSRGCVWSLGPLKLVLGEGVGDEQSLKAERSELKLKYKTSKTLLYFLAPSWNLRQK